MIISDLYSTRIQKSFDEDQSEILSILKANSGKSFKLINYYKGMPLSYPATVVSVERGAVDMDVQAEQAFAIEKSRFAFIRSPLFRHDILAELQYVNVKKRAASFIKFCYVENMAEHRNFIRLVPEPSVTAVIESPLGMIEGDVSDISLSGLCVSTRQYYPLAVDATLLTRFTLKNLEQTLNLDVSLPANLVIIKDERSPYSYIFSIRPDRQLESAISKYLFHRQIEIIREIKDAVD